uniref:Cytochrome P450 n=1 Tax=Arcella intermedia TaxID=1963864 RepID=A0A6B2L2U5_9EUKA
MEAIIYLALVVGVGFVILRLYQKYRYTSFAPAFPRSPTLPLLGSVHCINPLYPGRSFHDLHMKLGKMYVFNIFGMEVLYVSDPEICDYIETHIQEFDRGAWPWDLHMYAFGAELLFTIGGKKWEQRRKALNHSFGPIAQKAYIFPIIVERTKKILSYLEENQNTPIDLDKMSINLTMDVIFNYCFGTDLDEAEKNIIFDAFNAVLGEVKTINIFPLYKYIVTPARLDKWKKDKRLKSMIFNFISNYKPDSLVEKLVEKGLTKSEIYNEVLGLLFAGHDTTAHTLTWSIYKIAQDPLIGKKVNEEIEKMSELQSFTVINELEFANQFSYMKAVINETLRFYPQAAQHPVVALKDTNFNGIPVKKGSYILTNQFTIMRDPEYWDEPDTYNPDRFFQNPPMRIPADKAHLTPAKFFKPFITGPHVCIGKHLALSELQIILPSIFKNFAIKLVDPNKVVEPKQNFTLRPKDPIFFTAHKL